VKDSFAIWLRWSVKPGRVPEFIAAWEEVTRAMLAQGSYGSALFEGPDGTFYAMARWPNGKMRRDLMTEYLTDASLLALADSTAEFFPTLELTERVNMWTHVGDGI
jgi:hypothetical protein